MSHWERHMLLGIPLFSISRVKKCVPNLVKVKIILLYLLIISIPHVVKSSTGLLEKYFLVFSNIFLIILLRWIHKSEFWDDLFSYFIWFEQFINLHVDNFGQLYSLKTVALESLGILTSFYWQRESLFIDIITFI